MIKCVAIAGPTASGKTSLSVALAKIFGGEIVNCDSMQIYKYMNIGTAKPTESEMSGVRHHMLDFLPPDVPFSAEAYREGAMAAISDIQKRGKIPFIVGGTGLYLDTLLRAPSPDVPKSSPEYRDRLLSLIKDDCDKEKLWQRLLEIDPKSAQIIHKNNVKRVIRALEIYDTTGFPKSHFDSLTRESKSELSALIILLDFHRRQTLYDRIDGRVDEMFDMGLKEEVEELYSKGYLREPATAAGAIGYKELISHILGKSTLDEAKEEIKLASRRYAKRQLTWFRHERDAVSVYLDDESGAMLPREAVLSCTAEIVKNFTGDN